MPYSVRRSLISLCLFVLIANGAQAQIIHDILDESVNLSAPSVTTLGKRSTFLHESDLLSSPMTGVAVEFAVDSDNVRTAFRFQIGGSWTDWEDAELVYSATSNTIIAGYHQLEVIDARQFAVRIDVPAESEVEMRSAGVFDNRADSDRLPPSGVQPIEGSKSGTIIPPPLITRAEWSAQPFIRGNPVPLASPTYDYMTFHHAAGYSATTREEGERQMRAMQDLHQNVRGWSDIGYQFAIDRGGRLYQGRPFLDSSVSLDEVPVLARGAHVGGHNSGNVGVVIMGCYHPPEGSHCREEITPEAFNTYIVLFSFLSERYDIEPAMIFGHRDWASTACPGDNNYARIPELKTRVLSLLETGNEPLGEAVLTASVDQDGVVTIDWQFTADFGIETVEIERITSEGSAIVYTGTAVPHTISDASLAGLNEATYVLIASDGTGKRQELARADVQIAAPSGYVLTSSFPNPTSGNAEFRYYLPEDGLVSIHLYDAGGRLVRSVSESFLKGDNWYSATVDLSNETGGLYFYRIVVEGFAGVTFDKSHAIALIR